MAINGNDIIVSVYDGSAWVAVAATKSDELLADSELIEKASATQQEWKEHIPGRKEWSLNVSWLVTAVSDIRQVLKIGTRVQMRIGGRSYDASAGVTGYAFVKTCKVSMAKGNLANGSFAFVGDGSLE